MDSSPFRDARKALRAEDFDAFDSVIASGFDPNTKTAGDHWNLLHASLVSVMKKPSIRVIKRLIDLGVDVDARDAEGWTPLHFAVRTKDTDVVQALIDANATVNVLNEEGISPLHLCFTLSPFQKRIAGALLAAGADPRLQNGETGSGYSYVCKVVGTEDDPRVEVLKKYGRW